LSSRVTSSGPGQCSLVSIDLGQIAINTAESGVSLLQPSTSFSSAPSWRRNFLSAA
jgi:hypothetical protein